MQTRLFACIAGGLIGVAVTSTMNVTMGLSPVIALVACSMAGIAIGYVASVLVDVFTMDSKGKKS